MATRERPLSPHLQVYRPQLTSAMSIFHRITGCALTVGALMIVWWLVAAARGAAAYNAFSDFASGPFGILVLFGFSVALYYHLCAGIRHLMWDAGHGLDLKTAYRSGYIALGATAVLTVVTWVAVAVILLAD